MPPEPRIFKTRYGPSRPSSSGACAGARKSIKARELLDAGSEADEGGSVASPDPATDPVCLFVARRLRAGTTDRDNRGSRFGN